MSRDGRTHRKRTRRRLAISSGAHSNRGSEGRLLTWMEANGFRLHSKLGLRDFPDTGRGVVALEKLVGGETFLKLPATLLISTRTALQSRLHSFIIRHHAKLTPIDVLTLFVLDQKLLGEASRWWPFVDSLPRTFTTPVFLRRKVFESLPKDLREEVQTGITFIQRTFLKLKVLLGGHVEEEPEVQCLSTGFTWNNFVWAWTAVNTRCIFAQGSNSSSLWEDDHCALAPFLDCLNHHWKASIETAMVGENFEILSHKSHDANEQVFISYGPHSNRRLFLDYGFVLPDNPNDVVVVTKDHLVKLYSLHENTMPHFQSKLDFLESKNVLSTTTGFTKEGLSWNGKAVIRTLLCTSHDRKQWQSLLFCSEETELDSSQCCLAASLIKVILSDYNLPVAQGKDWSSQLVTALMNEEVGILRKQLCMYQKQTLIQ
ncbi:SET domain-containing protein, putative [Ixodes scapularis]|uniref:SET domain-containing protein, putative n=1 Tax=Ixodes scapularis TaxID=6945 RepID=B7PZP0_IXOSC|nr:SET domain-containing protein, putative [Ixodes scapularis]|eukprot:XP_002405757.1 SET domain-containing protein, putative [Ixodes scapularis]